MLKFLYRLIMFVPGLIMALLFIFGWLITGAPVKITIAEYR